MANVTLRCTRCGYAPMAARGPGLHAGSPCPQCAQPLVAAGAEEVPGPPGVARPVGIEDRRELRARRARAAATTARGRLGKLVVLAFWAIVAAGILGRSPARLVALLERQVTRLARGGPTATPSQPGTFGPAADFQPIEGTWIGSALGEQPLWTFRFAAPARVHVTEADGSERRAEARVYWERAADEGLSVLPGGQPLDLVFEGNAGGPPAIVLGTYRLRSADSMELCLGRPGGLVRTSELRSTGEITCWLLVRTSRVPPGVPPDRQ